MRQATFRVSASACSLSDVDCRSAEVLQLREQGATLDAIGRRFRLTAERVRQVLSGDLDVRRAKVRDLTPNPAEEPGAGYTK